MLFSVALFSTEYFCAGVSKVYGPHDSLQIAQL